MLKSSALLSCRTLQNGVGIIEKQFASRPTVGLDEIITIKYIDFTVYIITYLSHKRVTQSTSFRGGFVNFL